MPAFNLKLFLINHRITAYLGAQGVVMKKWKILPMLFIIGLFVTACQASIQTPKHSVAFPADLKITYGWNTGALPPKYHYSYEIVIQADGGGQFIYQQSYAGNGAPMPSVSTFIVPPEKMNQLYQLLLTKNILRTAWAKNEPLIGGSSSDMQIVAEGKTFSIPNDAVMINQDRSDSAEFYDYIKVLVPVSIWDDLTKKRQISDAATDAPAK
jgi:hypothetical protein